MSRLLIHSVALLCSGLVSAAWAMEVDWGVNGPEVRVDNAELAAFMLREGELWVVAPQRRGVSVSTAFKAHAPWRAEPLQVSGGEGVRLLGRAADWTLTGSPNAWRVVRGGASVARGYASVAVFQDGTLRGDGHVLQVQSVDGVRYRVLTTAGERMADLAGGWTATLAGVARAEHAALATRTVAVPVASVEPAAGSYKVPFRVAENLPALATPVGDHQAIVEGVMPDLKDVYRPGEVHDFVLPKGVRLENGKVVGVDVSGDAQTLERKIELARAVGAMGDATRVADEVLARKIPSKLPFVAKPVAHGMAHVSVSVDMADISGTTEIDVGDGFLPKATNRKDYLPYLVMLQHQITLAKTEEAKVEARRALAKFYIAWQRPEEALSILGMMPRAKNGILRDADDRLLMAMANVVLHRPEEALDALDRVGSSMAQHVAVWRTVALQQQGRSAEALKSWPAKPKVVETYPAYVRDLIRSAIADALLTVGDAGQSLAYVDKMVTSYPKGQVPADVLRLAGLALLRANKTAEGLDALAKASESVQDMATAYRAKYEFVTALRQQHEIDDKQLINYLEELRLFWRGDDVEPRVLRDLGDLYAKRRDYRQALARWRTLVRVYPNIPDMAYITDRMTQSLLAVFDPENPEVYDAVTYAGLFLDFRELLPNDERGDRVAERVGRLLTESTLAERAVPILEQILRYRPGEQTDRARLSVLLAKAYVGLGRPEDAIKLLDSLGNNIPNSVLRQQAKLRGAEALIELERYDDALDMLAKAENDPSARQLKAEAGWQAGKWPLLRDLLTAELSGVPDREMNDNTALQLSLMRLGYALAQLRQGNDIVALQRKYETTLATHPVMADSLAAMASMVGSVPASGGDRALSQVAGALARLNTFGDSFREREAMVKRSLKEQEEYNNRMKYMEILPPPNL